MIAPSANAVMSFLFGYPLVTHAALLAGDVLATIAVGVGILWESPKQSERRQRIAVWLVILGVGVETLCSVSLFAFDEAISQSQQAKIIRLETHLQSALTVLCEQDLGVQEEDQTACSGDAFK
jgi:hypothetical protein